MWIRSQDKEALVKVNTFKIIWSGGTSYGIFTNDFSSLNVEKSIRLATYSTKEKALKVLDMIHKYIKNEKIFIDNLGDRNIAYEKYAVLEMPQDDEVDWR